MEDLTGKTFGRWTVLKWESLRGKINYYTCTCSCGTIRIVSSVDLKYGNSFSCGCLVRGRKYHDENVIGKKYGRLTGIEFIENKDGKYFYNWVCDCGNYIVLPLAKVIGSKTIPSCGCYFKEVAGKHRIGVPSKGRKDLTGNVYGKLTVLKFLGTFSYYHGEKASKYLCKCECGNTKECFGIPLQNGVLNSCGCARKKS